MRWLVLGLVVALSVSVARLASAADIYPYGDKSTLLIAVRGDIRLGDLAKLQIVHERESPQRNGMLVDFDSNGGDLGEAIAVGRWIREVKASTGITEQHSCASACVYAFAGGTRKFPLGALLIHRPFFTHRPQSDIGAELRSTLAVSRS